MSLVKRIYVDGETVIIAQNLNDIQDAIIENEEDIATKGTYSKPSGGIPKTDLATAVQTSLGKADTALQSTDIDNTLSVAGKAADAKKTGDEISGVKNTLSHKADVIYDTASGDIASFPDGADGLPVKDLTVAIEPVQSGTGDPSPTNVRPISGWTGANVTRTGKNLAGTKVTNRYPSGNSSNAAVNILNGVITCESFIKQGGVYTITAYGGNRFSVYVSDKPIADYDNNEPINVVYTHDREGGEITRYSYTFNNIPDNKYVGVYVSNTSGGDSVVQVEKGSESTAYESFSGTTIPISWQSSAGTVYGGTLDVTSGVLTVTMAIADLGTLAWNKDGDNRFYSVFSDDSIVVPSAIGDLPSFICSVYKATYYTQYMNRLTDKIIAGGKAGNHPAIFVYDTAYNDATTFASAMSGVQLVYELVTPQTYQLDPVTVSTLLGQNNIWADCGPSTVEYPCDTKLYIQKINTPTDDDMIADAQIASGKYFIVGNNLYLSTTTILAGDPIKPGTNCTLTNLAAALNAINS